MKIKSIVFLALLSAPANAQTLPPLQFYAGSNSAPDPTSFRLRLTGSGATCGPGSGADTGKEVCTFSSSNGTVTSISNSDGTLTLTPNPITATGTLALALGHANTWTATQAFPAASIPNTTLANSTITVNAPSFQTGWGSVALGASLSPSWSTESANAVLAGPTSGGAVAPTFRSLVAADIPSLSMTYLPLVGGTMTGAITFSGTQLGTYTLGGTPTLAGPTITGTIAGTPTWSSGLNLAANQAITAASAATNTTGLTITSNVADGASSIGLLLNNSATLSTAGSRLLKIQNNGTDEVTVDQNGNIRLPNAGSGIFVPNASGVGIYNIANTKGIFADISTLAGGVYGGDFGPYVDNSYGSGNVAHRWAASWVYWSDTRMGAQLTADSTITPTSGLHHVTGATPITTIATTNLPTGGNIRLTIIADSATITWSTGGNIGAAGTLSQGKAQDFVFDSSATTWYPVQ